MINQPSDQQILQERARKLAVRKSDQNPEGESILAIEFLLLPEKYCIDSSCIAEVLPLKDITPIPGTPSFVLGVMNVRGKIISVIDLKSFLHLKEIGIMESNKVMVVKSQEIEFGILTDAIEGTRQIYLNSLIAPPVTINGIGAEYIKGITTDGRILLEAKTLLSNKSIKVMDQ